MLRRGVLRAGAVTGAVAVAGCRSGRSDSAFDEGFEDGLGDWNSGAAIGPEVKLEDFEWEFGVSGTEAASGDRSLRIWNEGDYDDGVTWGVHPVTIESGQAYQATVTAQFWSESESFNTLRNAVMRLGPEPPEVEEDFPHPAVNTTELGETPYGGAPRAAVAGRRLARVPLRVDDARTLDGYALYCPRARRGLGRRRDTLHRRHQH